MEGFCQGVARVPLVDWMPTTTLLRNTDLFSKFHLISELSPWKSGREFATYCLTSFAIWASIFIESFRALALAFSDPMTEWVSGKQGLGTTLGQVIGLIGYVESNLFTSLALPIIFTVGLFSKECRCVFKDVCESALKSADKDKYLLVKVIQERNEALKEVARIRDSLNEAATDVSLLGTRVNKMGRLIEQHEELEEMDVTVTDNEELWARLELVTAERDQLREKFEQLKKPS